MMSGKLRQAAKKLADSTVTAATPLRWIVQVKTVTDRETTGLVEVERVGTGQEFWIQVRNSVYLADDDLIWIVKDTGAQGNWIFAGFVEGAGTGESLADSPIPSVATPVVTSPAGTPLIVRPVAGQQGTFGRVGETVNFAGGINVAEGITFGNFGAGIVQTSAAGVMTSDYIIDATMTMATAMNIVPADASGQDLGNTTHRWDLYTQDVIFGGATGADAVTVPDNLADALHLSDAGGIEYIRIISTNAQPVVVFNEGGVDVDWRVEGVGQANALFVQGSDGLVGIRKVPASVLDVAGTIRSTDQVAPTSGAGIELAWDGAAGVARAYDRDAPGYVPFAFSGSEIQFNVGGGAVEMTLTAAGMLGLGTTTPSTRLDIDAGAMELAEMTAPGAGAANTGRLYLVDNAGKTELYMIFNTGAAQLIAAQP